MSKNTNIISIDPSSTCTGVAFLKNGEVQEFAHWNKNKKASLNANLYDYSLFLRRFRAKRKIDIVASEEVSHSRNVNTIRKIAYFESIGLLLAGEWKAKIMLFKPASHRKLALGNGNFTKEFCYNKLSKTYRFSAYDAGGNDESDAVSVGLAAWKEFNSNGKHKL